MEATLWRRYREKGSLSARDELVLFYTPFAHRLAKQVFRAWSGSELLLEDFVQCALVGLIESVERFDTSKNVAFKDYARFRIRGAMLNSIRKVSEYLDYNAYKRQQARDRLRSIYHERTKDSGTEFEFFANVTADYAVALMLGFDEVEDDIDLNTGYCGSPERECLYTQLRHQCARLSERSRTVVELHYFNGLTFEEVASVLGLAKSTVSAIHARAVGELRRGCSLRESGLELTL